MQPKINVQSLKSTPDSLKQRLKALERKRSLGAPDRVEFRILEHSRPSVRFSLLVLSEKEILFSLCVWETTGNLYPLIACISSRRMRRESLSHRVIFLQNATRRKNLSLQFKTTLKFPNSSILPILFWYSLSKRFLLYSIWAYQQDQCRTWMILVSIAQSDGRAWIGQKNSLRV